MLPGPLERGLGKTGRFFHRLVAKLNGDGDQAAQEMGNHFIKPAAPTVNSGFVRCDGQAGVPGYHYFYASAAITFVWDEDIWKFMMYPPTVVATEPANDECYFVSKAIYVFTPPAADDIQLPVAAGAGNLLRTLYEKPFLWGFQLAHILIQ